jgi:hypothetical protein
MFLFQLSEILMTEIQDLEPGQAITIDWTADEYHADRQCVSRSQLVDLPENPAIFIAKQRGEIEQAPSKALDFGTHVHLALLEPDEWRRRLYEPAPEKPYGADGRRKSGSPERDIYDDWKSESAAWTRGLHLRPDAIILSHEERFAVERCAGSMRQHPIVEALFDAPGSNEQTVIWRCPDPDVLVRVRCDRIAFPDDETVVIFDAKTSKDPSPSAFGKSMAIYGYDVQGAIYSDAGQALFPDKAVHFIFGVARSRAPWEAACYSLEAEEYEAGHRKYTTALHDLVRRRETDDWIAPWQRGLHQARMPRWALTTTQDEQ